MRRGMLSMATIKEVAKRTGVSASTVSRALANKLYVRDATRQRILAAVEELGYRPNFMAKGLKAGTTMTFALVIPDITNPFYPKLVKSIERYAATRGYSIILFDANEDKLREIRHFESILSHAVDGVILSSASDDVSHIAVLRRAGIPVVIVNRDFDVDAHRVTNDNEDGSYAMVKYLIDHGHRRIGCLLGSGELQRYRQRYMGCKRAFEDCGLEGFERYVVAGLESAEDAYEATRRLLAMAEAPTAIFSYIDIVAMGVYSAIYDSGLRIPDDVSVVGFDNIGLSQHMFPPLTTYEHPADGIARAAIDSLIDQIKSPHRPPPLLTVVKGGIVVRKSVRKRNA